MSLTSSLQHLLIIAVALCVFPLSISCLILNYVCLALLPSNPVLRRRLRQSPSFKPHVVLLTGVGSPQGLRIARAFHETGHVVVGADLKTSRIPLYVSFSTAVNRYYSLRIPAVEENTAAYARELLAIVEKERVDIWINCSNTSVASVDAQARFVLEQRTTCICFDLEKVDAPHFANRQDFLAFVQTIGLPVPETHQVKSRDDIHNVLNRTKGNRRYILNAPNGTTATGPRIQLPRRTVSQTYNEVARVRITKTTPWLLQQYLDGLEQYTTLSIISRGVVKTFVASPTGETGSTRALASNSALAQSLYRFVQTFASKLDADVCTHLSIDFCVDERVTETGVEKTVLPVNGRARANPSLLLFQGLAGSINLSRAYLSVLESPVNGSGGDSHRFALTDDTDSNNAVVMPVSTKEVYSFGHDLFQLLLRPMFQMLLWRTNPLQAARSVLTFANHVVSWQETTYEWWDPLPCWWLYQVYVPLELLRILVVNEVSARSATKSLKAITDMYSETSA